MLGTMPIFYKILVADELMYNVRHGTYPPQPTHISICYPPVPMILPSSWSTLASLGCSMGMGKPAVNGPQV